MTTALEVRPGQDVDLIGPLAALAEAGYLTATEFKIGQIIQITGREDTEERELEQWGAIGQFLGVLTKANRFWVADWLNFGEGTWGQKVSQFVEATGMNERTLTNWASVGRRVIPSRRRERLTWTHHVILAAVDADKQEEWAERALDNGWSTDDFKAAVDAHEPVRAKAAQPEWTPDDREHRPPVDAQQVVQAGRALWRSAQKDGDAYRVPADTFARFAAALGVGE